MKLKSNVMTKIQAATSEVRTDLPKSSPINGPSLAISAREDVKTGTVFLTIGEYATVLSEVQARSLHMALRKSANVLSRLRFQKKAKKKRAEKKPAS